MTLVMQVASLLREADIPFALIGAGAMAAHGVSRSTADHDLLVTDQRVLDQRFWVALSHAANIDVRRGDDADPLLGVVRLTAPGERPVDVVSGRGQWMDAIPRRSRAVTLSDGPLPVADAADLVLLKLYAGGSQDRWDVEQLLAISAEGTLVKQVEARLAEAPSDCRTQWDLIRRSR